MENEIKDNLIALLKLFKDNPTFLIKFLLENNAFTEEFLKKVFNSPDLNRMRTLKSIDNNSTDIFSELPHFKNIDSMNSYFSTLINGKEKLKKSENIYDLINKDLKERMFLDLQEAIDNQQFEKAAVIRDRMKELNIKIKKT